MTFQIVLTDEAKEAYDGLQTSDPGKHKKVKKTLGYMETNIRHPGLHTHEYSSLEGPKKEKVFEAYVENKTPGAYRVFWYFGPEQGQITVIAITPHP